MEEQLVGYNKPLGQIERATVSQAVTAEELGQENLDDQSPRKTQPVRLLLMRIVSILLLAASIKGYLIWYIGPDHVAALVETMMQGAVHERLLAYVLSPDPYSASVARGVDLIASML